MSSKADYPRAEIALARSALQRARLYMRDIAEPSPTWREGYGLTAEDNCKHTLDMIEHGLVLINTYLARI